MGLIGGAFGVRLLNLVAAPMPPSGSGADNVDTPLEKCFGPAVFDQVRGKTVLDFGCGTGLQAVEVARAGAGQVFGLDIQQRLIDAATRRAEAAGVADRCRFGTRFDGTVDIVLSKDAFEHFDDPAAVLSAMAGLLRPGGYVLASFGPTWLHPKGGHAFSVFPWSHLVFTERALLRWRSQYRDDGATRFSEIAGGLNQLTIGRFERLVAASPLKLDWLQPVPIRGIGLLASRALREWGSSLVRCRMSLR